MNEPGLNLARRGAWASRMTITAVATCSALFLKYASRLQTYGVQNFIKLVVPSSSGQHPRQDRRPLITVSNHASCIDDPVLMGVIPLPLLIRTCLQGFMRWTPGSRRICYANPLLAYFFGMGQVVPVSWGEGVHQEGMKIAQERLKMGDWVHIFPEGRVNQTNHIWPCRWGVGQLVMETARHHGVSPTILIVAHTGMEEVLSEDRIYIPRPGKEVRVAVSEPFNFDALIAHHKHSDSPDENTRAHITDVIQMKLADLHHRLRFHRDTLQTP